MGFSGITTVLFIIYWIYEWKNMKCSAYTSKRQCLSKKKFSFGIGNGNLCSALIAIGIKFRGRHVGKIWLLYAMLIKVSFGGCLGVHVLLFVGPLWSPWFYTWSEAYVLLACPSYPITNYLVPQDKNKMGQPATTFVVSIQSVHFNLPYNMGSLVQSYIFWTYAINGCGCL